MLCFRVVPHFPHFEHVHCLIELTSAAQIIACLISRYKFRFYTEKVKTWKTEIVRHLFKYIATLRFEGSK